MQTTLGAGMNMLHISSSQRKKERKKKKKKKKGAKFV